MVQNATNTVTNLVVVVIVLYYTHKHIPKHTHSVVNVFVRGQPSV